MGPILPQINVFGKELGVSPDIMGFIMSFLPILYVLAKPAIGFLIDYFPVSVQKPSWTLTQLKGPRIFGFFQFARVFGLIPLPEPMPGIQVYVSKRYQIKRIISFFSFICRAFEKQYSFRLFSWWSFAMLDFIWCRTSPFKTFQSNRRTISVKLLASVIHF